MSCSPVRLPRSLAESPAYDPEWRHLQVLEYLRCRRRASETGEAFVVPLTERDSMVRAYFKFRTQVTTPKAPLFRYAQDCFDTNDRSFMASRIKALTVAELSIADIATRLHTTPENIEVFQKLFFDVANYVHDRATLGALLLPLTDKCTTSGTRERVWLLAALKLGIKGLDYVMDQKVRLSTMEQQEISDSIHAILAEQTLAYSLSMQSKPEAGTEAMTAYHKSLELRLRHPSEQDDGKMDAFAAHLVRIAQESMARKAAENAQTQIAA